MTVDFKFCYIDFKHYSSGGFGGLGGFGLSAMILAPLKFESEFKIGPALM